MLFHGPWKRAEANGLAFLFRSASLPNLEFFVVFETTIGYPVCLRKNWHLIPDFHIRHFPMRRWFRLSGCIRLDTSWGQKMTRVAITQTSKLNNQKKNNNNDKKIIRYQQRVFILTSSSSRLTFCWARPKADSRISICDLCCCSVAFWAHSSISWRSLLVISSLSTKQETI
jgi:hypothetical protein